MLFSARATSTSPLGWILLAPERGCGGAGVRVSCPGLPPSPTWWLGWISLIRVSPKCPCEHLGAISWGPVHWAFLPALQAVDGQWGLEGGLQRVRWGQPSMAWEGAAHSPPSFAACETKAAHVCISFLQPNHTCRWFHTTWSLASFLSVEGISSILVLLELVLKFWSSKWIIKY